MPAGDDEPERAGAEIAPDLVAGESGDDPSPINDHDRYRTTHQSSNGQLMAFRMLRYVVGVWDRYLGDHPRATQLPAVVPLVVHRTGFRPGRSGLPPACPPGRWHPSRPR
ncbi:Rpn family recombination-promoting nuclease/putative transposase [Frankia sp. CiP3]|uniref:Rpn family recombination-promoting nuclease/putative transposase n=2 Tax=unclassified Frankia TaxID=2632575 RepID=UPI0035AB9025